MEKSPNSPEASSAGKSERPRKKRAVTTTENIDEIALLIASGKTVNEVAAEKKCAPVTVAKLIQDQEFRNSVLLYRQEYLHSIFGSLVSSGVKAVNCLSGIMDDPLSPTADRVKAARAVLELISDFRSASKEVEEMGIRGVQGKLPAPDPKLPTGTLLDRWKENKAKIIEAKVS